MADLKSTTIVSVPSNGEITINLNLNIKVDGNGQVSVDMKDSQKESVVKNKNIFEKDTSETLLDWQMPEFTEKDIIDFGNKTK